MSIAIRFMGGPADGHSHVVSGDEPPLLYLVPAPWSVTVLCSSPAELAPEVSRASEYEPLYDHGGLWRAPDGAYVYRYRVTPEQREALRQARAEAEAKEQARQEELDAAWQEIRMERPWYPEERPFR